MHKLGAHFYQDPVRSFIETMLSRAGFDGLSSESRAETVTALVIEVQRRVGKALMDTMDDGSRTYFRELMRNNGTEEEISAFFSVRITDYKKIIDSTLQAFSDECARSSASLGRA